MSRRTLSAAALTIAALLIAIPAAAQEIEVRDEGDEPRAELRYAWSEGLTGTTITTADTIIATMVNAVAEPEEQTTLEMTVSRTVTEVDDDGNARVEFSVQAPQREGPEEGIPAAEMLPGDATDVLLSAMAALSEYSGWMLLDPRGVLLDYGVDGLGEATAEFLVQTRGLAGQVMVLPEEPVGVGATWETYTEIYEAGLTFESEAATTLVDIDGETLTLEREETVFQEPDLGLEQVATTAGAIYASQELESSSTLELPLDGLVQTGTGEATLSIIAGAAVSSAGAEVQTDLTMEITATAGE